MSALTGSARDRTAARFRVVDLARAQADDLVAPWRALASSLPESSYFQTPDWVLAWWATVAREPPTRLACWFDDDGQLSALVGLSEIERRLHHRSPWSVRVLTNAGSGPGDADHCGPLVPAPMRTAATEWISRAAGSRSVVMSNVDGGTRPPLPEGAHLIAETTCPRLSVEHPDQPFVRSSGFRRQLRRYERQLAERGVTFAWVPPGEVDAPLIATLLALHFGRRTAAGAGSSLDERHRALLVRAAAAATPGAGPAAVVARTDSQVVGVLMGFVWKDTFSAYQSGWTPDLAMHSLGSVLLHRAIRSAAAEGIRTFDFLRGAEPYKYRFGAVDRHDATYLLPRGMSGRQLRFEQALRHAARRLNARTRRRRGHRGDSPG
jgi:CelD/BcsL family acetyltransferase involved in cellulose biosynthesis